MDFNLGFGPEEIRGRVGLEELVRVVFIVVKPVVYIFLQLHERECVCVFE